MAAGTPVVLPNAGGVLEYASEDNAWLAPSSVAGLARQVVTAWESVAERGRRRERALEIARALSWPTVAGR